MRHVGVGLARALFATTALVLPAPAALAAQTTQYTYDALGRVVSAIDANGRKVVYSYDAAGNRTRVSNGAEFQEINPTAWSASSNAGTTGLATSGALKDGDFNALASIHATAIEANAWIMADFGSAKTVNHIDVAPALAGAVGASPDDLNDTVVEYSIDASKWSAGPTINGVTPGASRSVALGGVTARYVRIHRTVSGQVAIGDLRFFSAAVANSPLIAQPDSVTSHGYAVNFDPRVNDQDLDGYGFVISSVEDPPHGTASLNNGAYITYTPDPGYFGADSFLYTVADGHNGVASAKVSVLVRPATNHAPVAVTDNFTVSDRVTAVVDGINTLRPVANDYDADADVLSITAKTDPAHGTVSIVGGSVVEYVPTVSYTGTDTFTYTISDGRGGSSTGTVSLTLGNAPPTAGPDNVAAQRSTPVTFDPRLNDRDPNGDVITVSAIATAPTKGVATLNPDQTITYQANVGVSGTDTLAYTLSDARGGLATGPVTIAISGNTAPIARNDAISMSGSAVTFDPRANDSDAEGDPLAIVGVTQPAHGTVTHNPATSTVTYTPPGGYTGVDSFTYTIADDEGGVATATVGVNALVAEYLVVGGGGGGGASQNSPGGGGGGGGGVQAGSMLLQASTPISVTVGGGGARGYFYLAPGAGGASSLGAVTAAGGGRGGGDQGGASGGGSGGGGGSAGGGGGTAGQGYAGGAGSSKAAGGGGGAGGAGGAGAYSCPSTCTGQAGAGGLGMTSAISGVAQQYAGGGGGGGLFIDGGDEIYGGVPGGSTGGAGNYPWSATDGVSGRGGGGGGGGYSVNEDGSTWRGPGGLGGSGVVVVRYAGPPRASGGAITQVGGYTIHTFTGTGSLTTTATNTLPVAANDTLTAASGAPRAFDPLANDSDADGDPLRVASFGPASHGTVSFNPAGAPLIYTPAAGYAGSDSFTYTISDGLASATATVNVTVVAGATFDYLIVGGGGGGGGSGGGGGGGGVRTGKLWLPNGNYSVTVGSGGYGATTGAPTPGQDSALGGFTAAGGGIGGTWNGVDGAGGPGGSGGGGGGEANYTYTVTAGAGGANAGLGGGGGGTAGFGGGGGGRSVNIVNDTATNGGNGGSGVVIIRYPTGTLFGSGGTVTTSGGYTIHTFTANGTFNSSDMYTPPIEPVFWSTTDKNSGISISGGDLTAQATTSGWKAGRATKSRSTGKFYFEATVSSGDLGVGLGNASASLGNYVGADGNGVFIYAHPTIGGGVFISGGGIGAWTSGTISSGDVIQVAVDLDAKRLWAKRTTDANWNASASANPATGVGGYDISGPAAGGALTPAVSIQSTGSTVTANFGASAFSGTRPSGYLDWDGS